MVRKTIKVWDKPALNYLKAAIKFIRKDSAQMQNL